MRIGSLFSGYGGLDRAVMQAFPGSTVAWHCEFDKAPSAILAHHYPNIPNLGDVTKVDWEQVEPVDIITGGSPCQDLSSAGKRAGMTEGTRSNLWVNMREAIAIIKPRLVVWENVQGALSAEAYSSSDMEPGQGFLGGGGGHLRALGRVLGDLAEIGYDARWATLRASEVGAPHHRARVFLIAYPADTGCVGLQAGHLLGRGNEEEVTVVNGSGQTFPYPADNGRERPRAARSRGAGPVDGSRGTIDWGAYGPAVRDGGMTNANATEAGSSEVLRDMRGGVLPQEVQWPTRGQNPIPEQKDMRTVMREQQEGGSGRFPQVEGTTDSQANGMRDMPLDPESACAPQGQEPGEQCGGKPGHTVRELPSETSLGGGQGLPGIHNQECDWGPYEPAIRRWERTLGRPAPNPTELNGDNRPRLNVEFASWMMGLPNGWVTGVPGLSRSNQLKAIGNGVVPQQAAAALLLLKGI